MLYGVNGDAVEAGSMDESKRPVFEAEVEAGEMPVGAISKLVVGEGSGNFALVTEVA